ncbi:hypothetical protein JCM6882_006316 [Rhodosporidiobolus microsporus]
MTSASPSAASRALSVASIASLVLEHVAIIDDTKMHGVGPVSLSIRIARRHLFFTSLISPLFRTLSQRKLQRNLLFDRGTTQMKQWLEFADKRGSDWVNEQVLFIEEPVEGTKVQAEDVDVKPLVIEWDVVVFMVVLSKLKKTETLWIALESLAKLPGDAFASCNFNHLKSLELPVPLSDSVHRPSFDLDLLFLHDRVPLPQNYGECCGKLHICCKCGSQHHAAIDCQLVRWGLPADWTNTLRLLSPPSNDSSDQGLWLLSLLHFDYFSLYLRDLRNLVPSVSVLELPRVDQWTQRSPHAVDLVRDCHNTQHLLLAGLPEPSITLSLLQAIPRTAPLKVFGLEWLSGKLGVDHPDVHPDAFEYCDCEDCRVEKRDPVAELIEVLRPMSRRGIQLVLVRNAKNVSETQVEAMQDEALRCGIKLCVLTRYLGYTAGEQSKLDRLIERSTKLFAEASSRD